MTTNIEEEVAVASAPILIATIPLDADYIATNPVTITASIPIREEEAIFVSGPCMPTVPDQYWNIFNGILTINYPAGDLTETARFPEEEDLTRIYIYTRTNVYVIILEVS